MSESINLRDGEGLDSVPVEALIMVGCHRCGLSRYLGLGRSFSHACPESVSMLDGSVVPALKVTWSAMWPGASATRGASPRGSIRT